MGRYQYTAYDSDNHPRYVVVWDLQWSVVECQQLGAGSNWYLLSALKGISNACEIRIEEATVQLDFFLQDQHDRTLGHLNITWPRHLRFLALLIISLTMILPVKF
jgi:hypothetical protein